MSLPGFTEAQASLPVKDGRIANAGLTVAQASLPVMRERA
jgi:hypothetical protein